jgi:hypothetical protein
MAAKVHQSPWTPKITREIHELTQRHLRSIRGAGRRWVVQPTTPVQRLEDYALRHGFTHAHSESQPSSSSKPLSAEQLDQLARSPEERDFFRQFPIDPPPRPSLAETLNAYADLEMIGTVEQNPRWLGAGPVLDRIKDYRSEIERGGDNSKIARRFLTAITKAVIPTKQRHRSRHHHRPAVALLFELARARAEAMKEAYLQVRQANPDDVVVELGRRLHQKLVNSADRPKDDEVKHFLGEICAVVPSRDNRRRLLTIEERSWPVACAYAFLASYLAISVPTIRRALQAK